VRRDSTNERSATQFATACSDPEKSGTEGVDAVILRISFLADSSMRCIQPVLHDSHTSLTVVE
jgi:hypothetical protein